MTFTLSTYDKEVLIFSSTKFIKLSTYNVHMTASDQCNPKLEYSDGFCVATLLVHQMSRFNFRQLRAEFQEKLTTIEGVAPAN